MQLVEETAKIIKLRQYQDTVKVCGKGVLLFGAWDMVKTTLYLFVDKEYHAQLVQSVADAGSNLGLTIVLIYIFLLLDLLARLGVARNALKEVKGKKRGVGYLIMTILLMAMSAYNIYYCVTGKNTMVDYSDSLVTALVECTALLNLTELFIFSVKLKRIKKQVKVGTK